MKISIIIPIFNEEKTIGEILKRVISVKLPSGVKREIIAVDDGSRDNSILRIKDQKSKIIKLLIHEKNMGKGAAVRTGIKHSTGNLIIIQDADLEYQPEAYPELLRPILEDSAEVVFGTRLKDYPLRLWGVKRTVMPLHLIANKTLTFLTNLMYGSNLSDMETGHKLFKKSVLKNISIKSNRFDFEPEITAKILKMRIPIVEIPIKIKPRSYKDGKKIGLKDGFSATWAILKYRFTD